MPTNEALQQEINTLSNELDLVAAELDGKNAVLQSQYESVQSQLESLRSTVNSMSVSDEVLQQRLDQQMANLSSSVHDMIDTTLAQSDQVLQSYTHITSVGIVSITILLAVVSGVGYLIQTWRKRKAQAELLETFIDRLVNDEVFSEHVTNELLSNEQHRSLVERTTRNMINGMMKNESEDSPVKGLLNPTDKQDER